MFVSADVDTHSLRVLTTVDRAGPLRESMMRIQGLEERTHDCVSEGSLCSLLQQGSGGLCRWRSSSACTHCLQRLGLVVRLEASEPRPSSARVPSSLHSSCTDTELIECVHARAHTRAHARARAHTHARTHARALWRTTRGGTGNNQ